mgnify:CR=1 FL=1
MENKDDLINEIAKHLTEDPNVYLDDPEKEIEGIKADTKTAPTKPSTKPETTPSKPDKKSSPFTPTKPAVMPDRKSFITEQK